MIEQKYIDIGRTRDTAQMMPMADSGGPSPTQMARMSPAAGNCPQARLVSVNQHPSHQSASNNMHIQHRQQQQQQQQQQHHQQQHQHQQQFANSPSNHHQVHHQLHQSPQRACSNRQPIQYITNTSNHTYQSLSQQTHDNHRNQSQLNQQHHCANLQQHNPQQQQQQIHLQPHQQVQHHSNNQMIYTARHEQQGTQLLIGQQQRPDAASQLCQAALVNAPPTPPSDALDQCPNQTQIYALSGSPNDPHQQTGAWVMQTIQQQQQQQHQQHQQSNGPQVNQQQQQQHQHQQTISSYYYDIDDGFSDIMSAPATPEPPMCQGGTIHHQSHHSQLESETEFHTNYSNYLPYSQQQQQQQHPHHQLASSQQHASYVGASEANHHLQQAYTVAMSPDSSSLSTTSSSPSDHSLYQASPPMPRAHFSHHHHHHQQPQPVLHANQPQQQQQQASSHAIKMEPVSQQSRTTVVTKAAAAVAPNQPVAHQQRSSPIHLWEFLKELLCQVDTSAPATATNTPTAASAAAAAACAVQPQTGPAAAADAAIIRWLDRQKGVFKIEDSVRVAKLWGKRKNKPKMNYDKLSRSIRQYYKKGIMKKTDRSQRLVYQFCSAYCH